MDWRAAALLEAMERVVAEEELVIVVEEEAPLALARVSALLDRAEAVKRLREAKGRVPLGVETAATLAELRGGLVQLLDVLEPAR